MLCSSCESPGTSHCATCSARYCGRTCQVADRERHKSVCRSTRQIHAEALRLAELNLLFTQTLKTLSHDLSPETIERACRDPAYGLRVRTSDERVDIDMLRSTTTTTASASEATARPKTYESHLFTWIADKQELTFETPRGKSRLDPASLAIDSTGCNNAHGLQLFIQQLLSETRVLASPFRETTFDAPRVYRALLDGVQLCSESDKATLAAGGEPSLPLRVELTAPTHPESVRLSVESDLKCRRRALYTVVVQFPKRCATSERKPAQLKPPAASAPESPMVIRAATALPIAPSRSASLSQLTGDRKEAVPPTHANWATLTGDAHALDQHSFGFFVDGKAGFVLQSYYGLYSMRAWLDFDAKLARSPHLPSPASEHYTQLREIQETPRHRGLLSGVRLLDLASDIDSLCSKRSEEQHGDCFARISGVQRRAPIAAPFYVVTYSRAIL